jgi:hypothetical protein
LRAFWAAKANAGNLFKRASAADIGEAFFRLADAYGVQRGFFQGALRKGADVRSAADNGGARSYIFDKKAYISDLIKEGGRGGHADDVGCEAFYAIGDDRGGVFPIGKIEYLHPVTLFANGSG